MVTKNQHPESLDEVNSLEITDEIKGHVNELCYRIQEEKNYRSKWEQEIDRLDRLRYGIRKKKVFPWPGCANHSIPLIDSDINRLKSYYVNLIRVSPIAVFEPFGPEDVDPARKREMLHDWRMRNKVSIFKPYCYGVDQVLGAPGMTVFRIIWKFSTRTYTEVVDLSEYPPEIIDAIFDPRVTDEMLAKILEEQIGVDMTFEENEDALNKAVEKFRAGKQEIEITLKEVKDDCPEIIACNVAEDLIVPRETKDLNDARFIDYQYWVSKNDLLISMRDGKYNEVDENTVDAWCGKNSSERSKNYGEKVSEDLVLLHETCCWYDINNDGVEERCITTWPDASPQEVLRFIELPYDHGMWPYVQVKRELTDPGFYATRGIPYLQEDFQTAISTAVNQAVDNGTLLNTPERVARKGVLSNPNNRRYIPGELTEVNGALSDYEVRQYANTSQPVLFNQAQYFKAWANERLGNQTSGMSSPTELPGTGAGGKKTAREVDATLALQNDAQSLDLTIFQDQFAGVHYQIDALYEQFGADEEEILTNQTPVKISRAEIQGKFNIIPNGRMDNSNPQLRLKRTMMAYQVGAQNPYVKQDELIKMVFRDIDEKMALRLLKTPEEMQKESQQAMAMKEASENTMIQKQFQVKKVDDDLEVRKAALLAPIQGKQFAPD